jgi:predicted nucleotidyltransferase
MDRTAKKRSFSFEELQRAVEPIARRYGMIRVYLFGSRARGDNRKDSDFDFCVVAPKGCSLMKMGSFLYDLRDALGTEVDIVSEEGLQSRPCFMEEVLRDRKIVFEA